MWSNLILLTCVLALSAALMYVSDLAVDFVSAATHVHCVSSKNYDACKEKFLNDVRIQMKQEK
jgi:hypothetical protein